MKIKKPLILLISLILLILSVTTASAKQITLVANSTGCYGYKQQTTSENLYATTLATSQTTTPWTALTSTELNALSVDDTSYATQAGSSSKDAFMFINFTLAQVQSVNYITLKFIGTTTTNAEWLIIGLYNATSPSGGGWTKLASGKPAAAGTYITLTYNLSSQADKDKYLKIDANNNLNFSFAVWNNGTVNSGLSNDLYEATINYNPVPPNITSWSNNYTNNNTLFFDVVVSTFVRFNVTANQIVTYNWTYDGIDQSQNFDNFTKQFTELGLHYVNATVSNDNGKDYKNWTINVIPSIIDVTVSNIPILFGNLVPGTVDQQALSNQGWPVIVIVHSNTNVPWNLSVRGGGDFNSGGNTFALGNLEFGNTSANVIYDMTTGYQGPALFANWVNQPAPTSDTSRTVYFEINIPAGQAPGDYSTTVYFNVTEYI